MTLKAVLCEYHRFDGPLQVGSHHIARHHRNRGFSISWLPHPQSPIRKFRGGLSEAVVEHGPDVTEVTLATLMPYYSLPVMGSAWWGERWISSVPKNRELLRRAGVDMNSGLRVPR